MKAPKFKEFISEANGDQKYKLVIITDEPEKAKTFHTADRLQEEAEKLADLPSNANNSLKCTMKYLPCLCNMWQD